MPLVDYESDEPDAEDEDENSAKAAAARAGRASEPPAKKRRVYQDGPPRTNTSLPPLPQAFHDQYASTVRLSNVDIPSLHQGRKRVNPHVPGNWPSHLYVECKFRSIECWLASTDTAQGTPSRMSTSSSPRS